MATLKNTGKVNVVNINPALIDDAYNPELEIIYLGNKKIFRETYNGETYEKTATYDNLGRLISVSKWIKI